MVEAEPANLILVGCVKRKRSQPCPARDLYESPLWRGRREYAERSGAPWYILSAEYYLLAPEVWISPYDLALKDLKREERRAWSRRVLDELRVRFPDLAGKTVECHAGKHYLDNELADGLRQAGAVVRRPLAGMRIGAQLRWYNEQLGPPVAGGRQSNG